MTDENPHEGLGDGDREGDPFERIDAPEEDAPGPDETDGFDVFGPPGEDRRDDAGESVPDGPSRDSVGESSVDPFADVDTPDGSPFDDPDGRFERVDVGGVDPDEVWASLTGDDADEPGGEAGAPDDSRYAEVSKHRFCEQCEHFSAPPEARCTEGTAEIVEFLDVETVRLLDCPVVTEQRALERDT